MHKLSAFIFCISFLLLGGGFPLVALAGVLLSIGLLCLGVAVYVCQAVTDRKPDYNRS
jgi:hypothetical protein